MCNHVGLKHFCSPLERALYWGPEFAKSVAGLHVPTQKMQVLIVFCGRDKIAGQEPDSPCFIVTATQTWLETGSVSYCSRNCVAHLASRFHLLFKFFHFLSHRRSSSLSPPGLNLAQGVLGLLECPETCPKVRWLWCSRSGQPGSAGWGADWAVESSSAQPGCRLLLLQELLRFFGNVIPTEEIQCRKDRVLLKAVLQRSVFIWWEEESVGLSITYLQ